MGFPRDNCEEALRCNGFDVTRAATWLVDQSGNASRGGGPGAGEAIPPHGCER
jgi:hypothetical protein